MQLKKRIELLSPAKDKYFGKTAIDFGADAVYIGAPILNARMAATNSIADIEELCKYAHNFHSKVFVALNTIIYDNELSKVEKIIKQLYESGADALIIQDFGILQMDLPPIEIHASTQMHNADLQRIKFLEQTGFNRAVLARELSLEQIKEISQNTKIELEAFIHGALCVSYSGQCYMSCYFGGRSGNRGECAQPCRLKYDLLDQNEKLIAQNKHILSLKDMNRSENIEQMLDSGITSLKIEGRLKDLTYVKNITAYYRKILDNIFEQRTEYTANSIGKCSFTFEPDPEKSFNRGFTDYFLNGRKPQINSLSPKSIGKKLGKVKFAEKNTLQIDTKEQIHNGDGLCYFDQFGEIVGFRVNKVEKGKIYATENLKIKVNTDIFRNYDHEFVKLLDKTENCRSIEINFTFNEIENGFKLFAQTVDKTYEAEVSIDTEKQPAQNEQKAVETLQNQLKKTGNSIFEVKSVEIKTDKIYFLPTSLINQLRRDVLEKLENMLGSKYFRNKRNLKQLKIETNSKELTYKANVSNKYAEEFFKNIGVEKIEPALETHNKLDNRELMVTKMCIKYNLWQCPKYQKADNKSIPTYLVLNGKKLKLKFDCQNCQMKIISPHYS